MAKYVYGIVENTAEPPAAAGIGGAPLELIHGDAAAALVSEVAGADLRIGREEMLAHARVLDEAFEHGTVLPMRIGTVLERAAEVERELLEDHAAELSGQLADLAGKVELKLRGLYNEDALMREVVGDDPRIAELRQLVAGESEDATYYARIELGQLVAAAVERRREHDADLIVGRLAPLAVAVDVGETTHEREVVKVSLLAQEARVAEIDRAVEELGQAQHGRITFRYAGPLPPYSFVTLAGSA